MRNRKVYALVFLHIGELKLPMTFHADCSKASETRPIQMITRIPLEGKDVCLSSDPLATAKIMQDIKPDLSTKKRPEENPNFRISVEAKNSQAQVKSWRVDRRNLHYFSTELKGNLRSRGYESVVGIMQKGSDLEEEKSSTFVDAKNLRMATISQRSEGDESWVVLSETNGGVTP